MIVTYLLHAVTIVAAFCVGNSVCRQNAARRAMMERERCARLALALRPHGPHALERMAAEHHAARIHAAILGVEAPVRRTPAGVAP